ncbi:MAG TPA: porphobilinogen synthase, partial [Candidatus Marinimicrobia bacterium]|nr:porphobilinogen synthase [Candidatus Neomarinimicrobiota bacterium]
MAIDLEHRQLIVRPRRLRRNANIRGLVRETRVTLDDLIMPVFITVGKNKKHEISSMPGIYQWSMDKV